jgi:hypothetical protein
MLKYVAINYKVHVCGLVDIPGPVRLGLRHPLGADPLGFTSAYSDAGPLVSAVPDECIFEEYLQHTLYM